MQTQRIAAIDIGSNSIKLAIAEAAAGRDAFAVVLQERERVRLGRKTLEKRFLSGEAVRRSARAVARFRSIAVAERVEVILAVATASVREAANAADFVEEVQARTGVRVRVLSALEEARLIGIAAAQDCGVNEETLLNIDIGGGSTELSLMRARQARKLFSMRLGAIGLTEKLISSNPPREDELAKLREEIRRALERPRRKLKNEKWQISSGTSGTILNLAALLNFPEHSSREIEFKRLAELNKRLVRLSTEERARMPCISPQRAEVIVAGGQILEGVMRALEIDAVKPCAFALREGVIIDYLKRKGRSGNRLAGGD